MPLWRSFLFGSFIYIIVTLTQLANFHTLLRDPSAMMILHFLPHSTIQLAELQSALLGYLSLPFLTEINGLFKLLYIICIQILWKGIVGIWKVSGEGWGVCMLFPCIIYHYKSSFLARTFAMNVQNLILGIYPKNLKRTKKKT